jgi:hypothetical protein
LIKNATTESPASLRREDVLRGVDTGAPRRAFNAEDRFLTLASLSTTVGVRDTITALLAGASVNLSSIPDAPARGCWNDVLADDSKQ